jgi:RsiW-degrading membrane proteinase PrsW (M82 family)
VQFVIVLVLALAPGIFWLWMVYRRDRYRPEPRGLVIRTFLLGTAAVIPVAAIEMGLIFAATGVLDITGFEGGSLGLVAYISFVVAGMTEEVGKFAVVRATIFRSPYFDEPMDGLVYGAAAALGFATLENVAYALSFGWEVILIRGPFTTIAHVVFSALWAYPLGTSKINPAGARGRVLAGLLAAIAGHGLFDFLVLSQSAYSLLALPFFFAGGGLFLILMRRAKRLSPYRDKVAETRVSCPGCGAEMPYYADFCTACGGLLRNAKAVGTVTCGKCGSAVDGADDFCTVCGSRLTRKPGGSGL